MLESNARRARAEKSTPRPQVIYDKKGRIIGHCADIRPALRELQRLAGEVGTVTVGGGALRAYYRWDGYGKNNHTYLVAYAVPPTPAGSRVTRHAVG